MTYTSITELQSGTGVEHFDAIFEVTEEFTLVFAGAPAEDENRLFAGSMFLAPNPQSYMIQPGVYGVVGWDDGVESQVHGLDVFLALTREEVDALVELGYVKYLSKPD